jgi:CheY-like chemotaxis protein
VVGASPGRQYGVRVAHDRPATQHIPVIISSAYRHLLDAEEAHLRAQGYVLVDTPYRIEDLLAAVHMLLGDDHAHAVGA